MIIFIISPNNGLFGCGHRRKKEIALIHRFDASSERKGWHHLHSFIGTDMRVLSSTELIFIVSRRNEDVRIDIEINKWKMITQTTTTTTTSLSEPRPREENSLMSSWLVSEPNKRHLFARQVIREVLSLIDSCSEDYGEIQWFSNGNARSPNASNWWISFRASRPVFAFWFSDIALALFVIVGTWLAFILEEFSIRDTIENSKSNGSYTGDRSSPSDSSTSNAQTSGRKARWSTFLLSAVCIRCLYFI